MLDPRSARTEASGCWSRGGRASQAVGLCLPHTWGTSFVPSLWDDGGERGPVGEQPMSAEAQARAPGPGWGPSSPSAVPLAGDWV